MNVMLGELRHSFLELDPNKGAPRTAAGKHKGDYAAASPQVDSPSPLCQTGKRAQEQGIEGKAVTVPLLENLEIVSPELIQGFRPFLRSATHRHSPPPLRLRLNSHSRPTIRRKIANEVSVRYLPTLKGSGSKVNSTRCRPGGR